MLTDTTRFPEIPPTHTSSTSRTKLEMITISSNLNQISIRFEKNELQDEILHPTPSEQKLIFEMTRDFIINHIPLIPSIHPNPEPHLQLSSTSLSP